MYFKVCAFLFLSSGISLARSRLRGDEPDCLTSRESELYEELEKALLNNTDNLYYLQKTFYPPTPSPPDKVKIIVYLTVDEIQHMCNSSFDFRGCYWNDTQSKWICRDDTYYWTTNAKVNLQYNLKKVIRGLYPTLNVLQNDFYAFMLLFTGDYLVDDSTNPTDNVNTTISLQVKSLLQMPSDDELDDAFLSLLVWVKGFARAGGKPTVRLEGDKGFVSNFADPSNDNLLSPNDLGHLLLGIQALVYVFFSLLVAKFLHGIFLQSIVNISITTYGYSLYWGTAYITGVYNVVVIIYRLYFLSYYQHPWLCYQSVFSIFELVIAWWATREHCQASRPPMLLANVCCCCWVFHCCSRYRYRFVHTLALVNMIWFSHTIISGLIVVPFFLAIHPTTTVIALTMLVMGLVSVMLFGSSIVHLFVNHGRPSTSNARHKTMDNCTTMILIALFFCIIILILLLYASLVTNGLSTAGVGGLVLALIPPVVLTTAGYYVKKKLFGGHSSEENVETGSSEQQDNEQQQNSPGDDVIVIAEQTPDQDETTPLLIN